MVVVQLLDGLWKQFLCHLPDPCYTIAKKHLLTRLLKADARRHPLDPLPKRCRDRRTPAGYDALSTAAM